MIRKITVPNPPTTPMCPIIGVVYSEKIALCMKGNCGVHGAYAPFTWCTGTRYIMIVHNLSGAYAMSASAS